MKEYWPEVAGGVRPMGNNVVSLTANPEPTTIVAVRRILPRWAVLVILVAMLSGHVTELFDRWDPPLTTGRDVDYTVVIVAACAGVVFAVAKALLARFRHLPCQKASPEQQTFSFLQAMFPDISKAGPSPPLLLPLRI